MSSRDEDPAWPNLGSSGADPNQRRNIYTGKTYNSPDGIARFFGDRGMPSNAPRAGAPPAASRPNPSSAPFSQPPLSRPPAASKPLPSGAPAARKGPRAGMMVVHPKYGSGTIVRREGDGDDAKITVNFPGFGLKKLVEKYAGLIKDR